MFTGAPTGYVNTRDDAAKDEPRLYSGGSAVACQQVTFASVPPFDRRSHEGDCTRQRQQEREAVARERADDRT
jgi:hypothetical protein